MLLVIGNAIMLWESVREICLLTKLKKIEIKIKLKSQMYKNDKRKISSNKNFSFIPFLNS